MPVVPFEKIKKNKTEKPQLKDRPSYIGGKVHDITSNESDNVTSSKIDKHIEIVMIPERATIGMEEENVGIILDEFTILEVLSQRYKTVCISVIETEEDLQELVAKKPDLVFSGIKYFNFHDEDNKHKWFSDYLAENNIAFIGSPSEIFKKADDKAQSKEIALSAGVNTASFFTTEPDELTLEQSLKIDFPVFVKPDRGGDSKGIDANSIVTNFENLKAKVLDIYQHKQKRSLVETYLPGKEYTVGVLENSANGELTAMPVEIVSAKNKNGDRILDFDTKKNGGEQVIKITSPEIKKSTSKLALKVFKALNAKSHARIDIKMDGHGVPHFLEVNLIPGLGKGGNYFHRTCALSKDMSYEHMIYQITDNALANFSNCMLLEKSNVELA